ncbi:MAG: pseudouridine synthase [Bryobacteraceae bacterium]
MPRYLIFNKPYNVLSQFSGGAGATLKNYISTPDVYPVGRLDRDSEGLMLLTDDGWLQHRLSNPRFEHPRTYWVQVEGIPDAAALEKLEKGVVIQNLLTRPANARLLGQDPQLPPRDPPIRFRKSIPTAWIEITLTEGRNRQVRRMMAAAGYPALRLVRVGIGPLRLGKLTPGESRKLTPAEFDAIRAPRR